MRLIDADAITWEKVCECFDRCFELREYNDSYKIESIMDIINTIPTVDPMKHGHWIERVREERIFEDGVNKFIGCDCSECGHQLGGFLKMVKMLNAYCPMCGAKMDEEVSE